MPATSSSGFPSKDFRPIVSNLSTPMEKFEDEEPPYSDLWTKEPAKELQNARSDLKGWFVTRFYETWAGNSVREFANFIVEAFRCLREFRRMRDPHEWNRPEPTYFKIRLNDGHEAYYLREKAFRLGYRHVLATVPLYRVNGQIELDPSKVPNPLQRRKLELLEDMLEARVRKIPYPVARSDDGKPLDIYPFPYYKLYTPVPTALKGVAAFYRKELETCLDEFDFINPNKPSDVDKYREFTAYIDQRSRDLPMEELSKQARAVIDIAGRIDALAKSGIKVNRRSFIALITGTEMLPEKFVPGAKSFNERALKVAQRHLRLAASAYVRSLLEHVLPITREEIRDTIREFLTEERLYGLKRSAFIRRIHDEISAETEGLKIDDDLLDIDSEAEGRMAFISKKLGLKDHEFLDPVSMFELFLQLGFLKKDEHIIEKRLEINSFVDAYQLFKKTDKNSLNRMHQVSREDTVANESRNSVWEIVDAQNRIRYSIRNSNPDARENVQYAESLSPDVLLDRAIHYCEEPTFLRPSTIKRLSGVLHENVEWLKRQIYELAKIPSRSASQNMELKRLQNRLNICSNGLDKLNAELKIRGEFSSIRLSPKGELAELYAKNQLDFLKLYYGLVKHGVNSLSNQQVFVEAIGRLNKETITCLSKVKRRLLESVSDLDKKMLGKQQEVLKQHLWVLSLLSPQTIEKMKHLERIEEDTKKGLNNSLTPYYDLQMEIFKNAPQLITKAPKDGRWVLDQIWEVCNVEETDLPMVAQKYVEMLSDDQSFFKRLDSLAAQGSLVLHRPTDTKKIEQYLSFIVPLDERLKVLAGKLSAEQSSVFKTDMATLAKTIDTLQAAKEMITRKTQKTQTETAKAPAPSSSFIKKAAAPIATDFTEAAKKVQIARNKYFAAWLALETEYFDFYNHPAIGTERDDIFKSLVQSTKFKDLIQSGEEWEKSVKDFLAGINRNEMPAAYDELEKALKVLSNQLPLLYQRNADALHAVFKLRKEPLQ